MDTTTKLLDDLNRYIGIYEDKIRRIQADINRLKTQISNTQELHFPTTWTFKSREQVFTEFIVDGVAISLCIQPVLIYLDNKNLTIPDTLIKDIDDKLDKNESNLHQLLIDYLDNKLNEFDGNIYKLMHEECYL